MQVYVDLAIAKDTLESRVWVARLKLWLAEAPLGVVISVRDERSELGDVVTATEVIEFIRAHGVRNPPYNGRSVFYYLVEKLHDQLVVCCTQCLRRYGVCRCEDRGYDLGGEWGHAGHLMPGSASSQQFWVITRDSLVAIDLDRLPHDYVKLRSERVRAFLTHLKQ